MWKHDFTVIVNADGSFSGTSNTTDNGGAFAWAETVTGSFNADKTRVSFKTLPVGGGATFKVTDAAYNVSVDVDTEGTWPANDIQMMVSTPDITSATTTTPGTESVRKPRPVRQGAGRRQGSRAGLPRMPSVSTQGK